MLVSFIIIMVNGNLGTSVAVLGAFSLIRFRSVAGSSKEIDLLAAQIKHISEEIPPIGVEEAEEKAFTEAAEEYENETFIRNHRGFINRK